ncbi:MAG: hypothetical protein CL674_00835 [Bdellovibrionaceae bacterium]|nr:hypothetical protein [Pseudobdellovibrionaceae bacterium]|tara:strand:- start:8267 stop:8764 length:498 start_codon:yes stop_codon:yes gene_type:complete
MKPVLELIIDLGFRKVEDLASNITKDIQQSLNESFRMLTALNFLALVMAISFVALVASLYHWVLSANAIVVGPIQWLLLSVFIIVISAITFLAIDRKLGNFKREQMKQNEQWVEIGSLALSFVKDFYDKQKLEEEIYLLRQELEKTKQHDFQTRYKETTPTNLHL